MKKQKSLADLLFEDDRLLKEEEDDDIFGDDDDGDDEADDEGGDDESEDDEGDEDEEGEDDDSDEEGGDDDSDGDDDDKEETPSGPADDTIDGEVNNLLADFEAEAVTSAEQAEELQGESVRFSNMHKHPVSKLLFEGDQPFDVSHFANNIARVIDNYQTLMDVEKMIFDKAKDFLEAKYGEQVAKEFEDTMEQDHQMTFVTGAPNDSSAENSDTLPVAVGAMTPA